MRYKMTWVAACVSLIAVVLPNTAASAMEGGAPGGVAGAGGPETAPSPSATSSASSTVIAVQCDKCGRFGLYHVDRLIERYGIDAKLFEWEPEADCPRKVARNEHDPCGARFPYLSKVV